MDRTVCPLFISHGAAYNTGLCVVQERGTTIERSVFIKNMPFYPSRLKSEQVNNSTTSAVRGYKYLSISLGPFTKKKLATEVSSSSEHIVYQVKSEQT